MRITPVAVLAGLLLGRCAAGPVMDAPPATATNWVSLGVAQQVILVPQLPPSAAGLAAFSSSYLSAASKTFPGAWVLGLNITAMPIGSFRSLQTADAAASPSTSSIMVFYHVDSTNPSATFSSLSSLIVTASLADPTTGQTPLGQAIVKSLSTLGMGNFAIAVEPPVLTVLSSGFLCSSGPKPPSLTAGQQFGLGLCFIFVALTMAVQYYLLLGGTQRPGYVGWMHAKAGDKDGKKSGKQDKPAGGASFSSTPAPADHSRKVVVDGMGDQLKSEANPLHQYPRASALALGAAAGSFSSQKSGSLGGGQSTMSFAGNSGSISGSIAGQGSISIQGPPMVVSNNAGSRISLLSAALGPPSPGTLAVTRRPDSSRVASSRVASSRVASSSVSSSAAIAAAAKPAPVPPAPPPLPASLSASLPSPPSPSSSPYSTSSKSLGTGRQAKSWL